MKRRISLLLAVVMILGTFSFTFAAEATPEEVAGEFLMDNDVIEGINGELKLEDNFRRQDMVVMISRLMGAADEAAEYPTDELTFTDFSDPYYRPIIAWAVAEELIEGHTDERFGFGEDVTAQQYATVLLRALGYNDEVAGDGYDEALELAADLGILGDYEFENDDAITRGEMFVMTFNALGVTMKDSDETLAEFLGIEMPEEDELEVVEVYTENLREVVVELSNAKLADEEKLADVNNYRLVGNSVEKVTVDGNDVIVLLKNALAKGRDYDLVLRNIDKDINGTHEFTARDNTIPAVVEVEALGEYGIKVTTSEPIDNPLERNFLIDGKNVAMDLEQYGRVIILTPYYDKAFPEDAETLTVKSLEDYAGYKSVEEDFDIEIVKDEVAPEVVDVIVKGNVVEVTFDKDIYEESVEGYVNRNRTGNISYKDGRHDIYAESGKKVDLNKAEYTFDDELPRRPEITISGVANHSDVAMDEVEVEGREVVDYSEPVIIDTWKGSYARDTENEDNSGLTIELTFDKDVVGIPTEVTKDVKDDADLRFVAEEHFDIYEREVHRRNKLTTDEKDKNNFDDYFVEVKYGSDKEGLRKDIIVIKLQGLNINNSDKDYDYVLEVRDFADATSSRNVMYRDYVDFNIPKASPAFIIEDIDVGTYRAGRDTEIEIEFNLPVDRVRAENPQNYLFGSYDLGQLGGDVLVDRNGYFVTLLIPDFDPADWSTLEILPILKDAWYSSRLSGARVYDFETGELLGVDVEPAPVKEVKINALNETQVAKAKVNAVAPVKANIKGIEFNNDVSSDDGFKLVITLGDTVTTKNYTVATKGGEPVDNAANVDALATAINADNLGVTATVVDGKLNLEADEAIEGMKLAASGSAINGTVPTPVDGVAEVEAADKVDQKVEVVFGKLADGIVKGMDVTFAGPASHGVAKVTDIKGDVVEVTITVTDDGTGSITGALDYDTEITSVSFNKGITTITLDANLKVTEAE